MITGVVSQRNTKPLTFILEQASGDINIVVSGPPVGDQEPGTIEWWDGTLDDVDATGTNKTISGSGSKRVLVRSKASEMALVEINCDAPGPDSIDLDHLSDLSELVVWPHNCSEVDISDMTSIDSLTLREGPLTSLVMGSHPLLSYVMLFDNDLSSAQVDAIFNALNTSIADGEINTSGGTNGAPTGASLAARNALIANGWTVTTN